MQSPAVDDPGLAAEATASPARARDTKAGESSVHVHVRVGTDDAPEYKTSTRGDGGDEGWHKFDIYLQAPGNFTRCDQETILVRMRG